MSKSGKTMRGYVIQEKSRAAWQDVPVPKIGPYDALVRPTAVATCITDVHLIDSLSLPNALGKVIGHEAGESVRASDGPHEREQVDAVLVASGGNASEQISTAMRMTKFGGHVSVVSGFFDDETVTLPMAL
jgi:threonine dehydrogenase-like Zn-dependent dehydrogenase